jgi:hypothetical protein
MILSHQAAGTATVQRTLFPSPEGLPNRRTHKSPITRRGVRRHGRPSSRRLPDVGLRGAAEADLGLLRQALKRKQCGLAGAELSWRSICPSSPPAMQESITADDHM